MLERHWRKCSREISENKTATIAPLPALQTATGAGDAGGEEEVAAAAGDGGEQLPVPDAAAAAKLTWREFYARVESAHAAAQGALRRQGVHQRLEAFGGTGLRLVRHGAKG